MMFDKWFTKVIPHDFEQLGYYPSVDQYMYQCKKCQCLIFESKIKKMDKLNYYYGDCIKGDLV